MDKHSFIELCVDAYAQQRHMAVPGVREFFTLFGVTDMLYSDYDLLKGLSPEQLIIEIDAFMNCCS
jgi:hypothetical protein